MNHERFPNRGRGMAMAAGLLIAACCPVVAHADGGMALPLKNGDFTEVVNVGSSRAIVWSHMAHWRPSHPRHILGGQHAGRWAAEFRSQNQAVYQDVATLAASTEGSTMFTLRFDAGRFAGANGELKAFVALHAPSGEVILSRSATINHLKGAWENHELALSAADAVPVGAFARVAFQRTDSSGGGILAVSRVTLHQQGTVLRR